MSMRYLRDLKNFAAQCRRLRRIKLWYTRAIRKGFTGRNSAVGLALREVVASLWRLRCRCCGSNASSGSTLVPGDASKRLLRPCCSPEPGGTIGIQLTGLFKS